MDNTLLEYLTTWFDPDDLIRLSVFTEDGGKSFGSVLAKDFAHMDMSAGIEAKANTYVQVYPTIKDLGLSNSVRGGEDNTRCIRGLYLDIDCGKTASFQTQREVLAYLKSFPLEPTMIVGSGSGGVHAYWRFTEDQPVTEKPLLFQWWVYAQSLAGDVTIDRLRDIARMLRVPGEHSYRFKNGEPPRRVCILKNSGRRYSRDELARASEGAYRAYESRLKPKREHEKKIAKQRVEFEGAYESDDWEENFNETYSWEYILSVAGWTHNRSLGDCEEWTRPGDDATARSATVDWTDSPHVMSLLSASEETGLSDLWIDGVPLSKFRVMLRLHYADNFLTMISELGLINGS